MTLLLKYKLKKNSKDWVTRTFQSAEQLNKFIQKSKSSIIGIDLSYCDETNPELDMNRIGIKNNIKNGSENGNENKLLIKKLMEQQNVIVDTIQFKLDLIKADYIRSDLYTFIFTIIIIYIGSIMFH